MVLVPDLLDSILNVIIKFRAERNDVRWTNVKTVKHSGFTAWHTESVLVVSKIAEINFQLCLIFCFSYYLFS